MVVNRGNVGGEYYKLSDKYMNCVTIIWMVGGCVLRYKQRSG